MNIKLNNIAKRYNYEWIFRKVNYEFTTENNYAILGANGSGKSTLLQIIAGNITHSEGEIEFIVQGSNSESNAIQVDAENRYKYISYAAPYLDLFEEFTLIESIEFQEKFKTFMPGLSTKDIIELSELEKVKNKQLKYYSSGMKQRVRLTLAILANTPLLLLDEPTSNLDKKAIDWYQQLVTNNAQNRLILVASNQLEYEYTFCNQKLEIEAFK